jgi:hypothetical protein
LDKKCEDLEGDILAEYVNNDYLKKELEKAQYTIKEKQIEIAKHITDLRDQAKQLELDAVQIMAEAKAEVEKIILG